MKKLIGAALFSLAMPVLADSYQVSYSWDRPVWQPSDTPTYGAVYRLDSDAAVVLPDTTLPGGGFSYVSEPGSVLKLCPINKNGTLVTPDCSQAEHWITVGSSPYPPTVPPMPSGFSATIIRTGD